MIKVLIADDEVPIRQWLEFCISKLEGYKVVGAVSNGAEGYSLFRKTLPDIVITDIRMPVMDGLEMLKMIQNLNPSVSTVVLTSHEDFEYARQAMKWGASDYILKTEITEEGLKELLDKAAMELQGQPQNEKEKMQDEVSNRNHYLRSLLLSPQTEVISQSMLTEYDVPIQNAELVVIDLMKTEEGISRLSIPDTELLTNMIKVPLDFNHTLILGNLNPDGAGSLGKKQEQLRQYGISLAGLVPCKIGCSDIYGGIRKLGTAMRQAHDRVNLGFYHTKETLFFTQAVEKNRLTNGEKYRIMFSRELVNQNFQRAIQIKNDMKEEARREEITDIDYLKKLYLSFVTSLLHTTAEYTEKVEKQLTEIGQNMMDAKSLEELEAVMEQAFKRYGRTGAEGEDYSTPIRNAIYYMESHYSQSITLSEVADHVSLSAEYLSRLFKEETGIKFVVYLNNIRLKHALHLLETTNLKVYEIAEQVGYSNLSYFSTVFKKNFGQNPFDYKNNR